MDDGIEVPLSHNDMDFGDEIYFSYEEDEFEVSSEDEMAIADKVDEFMQKSFNFGIDVYKLKYKSILDSAFVTCSGETISYIAESIDVNVNVKPS